ncbi:hypothetical protein EON63_08835 [archaeon]|nr:MAG: hypothetical protein EON63_08835 [archaeon]
MLYTIPYTLFKCGPTVYAESHMGHARTYVCLDILRRIMQEFFGYNVILCQVRYMDHTS